MPPTKHASSATTLSRSAGAAVGRSGNLLASGRVINSPETGLAYRVDRLIGEGGFGQAYGAGRIPFRPPGETQV